MNNRLFSLVIFFLSICLYVYSMFLPGVSLTITWAPNEILYGKDLLFVALFPVTALAAISYGGFALFANHLYITASILTVIGKIRSAQIVYATSMFLALTAVIPDTYLLDEGGGEGVISNLLTGYYVWLFSIFAGLIYATIKLESQDSLLKQVKGLALSNKFFPMSGFVFVVTFIFLVIKNLMKLIAINDNLLFLVMIIFAIFHIRLHIKEHPENKYLNLKNLFQGLFIFTCYLFSFGLLFL